MDPSCADLNSLPDAQHLPISSSIKYAYIHGTNMSDNAMVLCCGPNPVNIIWSCYEWCELPAKYTNTSDALKTSLSDFSSCLRHNGSNATSIGSNVNVNGASSGRAGLVSLKGASVVALVVACLVSAL